MATSTAIDLLAPVHRLTVEQYLQMSEAGLFGQDVRVELIEGVVVEMSAQGTPHLKAVSWLNREVVPQLPRELMLVPQSTLRMDELDSAPEPDIYIADERVLGDADALPLLIIEVSVSSLAYDRVTKSRLYARRGVPEYWVVNAAEEQIEVHRGPYEGSWGSRMVHGAGDTLEPLLLPGVRVDVGALLAFIA